MADLKISALTASTVPLAGTEVLPIVQSGATRQVSIINLTAGRAISATSITASTSNFIVGTSGRGVDFSAVTHAGSTSKLLNDYEEGTWTPVLTSSVGSITSYTASGSYRKVGTAVTILCRIVITNNGTGAGSLNITGFPFTAINATAISGATREDTAVGFGIVCSPTGTTAIILTNTVGAYPGGTNYGFTLCIPYIST